MRRTLLALVLSLAAACGGGGDEEASAPARGPTRGPGAASGATAPTAPAAPAPRAPDRAAEARREAARPPQPWGAGPLELTETVTETTPATPPPRDLGAELRSAIGTPTQCFDASVARSVAGTLRIPVRAYVSETGRITRVEVGGSAPESVRSCIATQVEALALRGPIPDAPRAVATELVLDLRADAAPTQVPSEAPEAPLPPGAIAPGIVLPAQGSGTPAPGYVAPSSTLPAVGADDRPAGFVPPSSTLPARVD